MSGWQEVRRVRQDDWKSDMVEFGEPSALIYSTTSMLALPAIVLDSGWYLFGIVTLMPHTHMHTHTPIFGKTVFNGTLKIRIALLLLSTKLHHVPKTRPNQFEDVGES